MYLFGYRERKREGRERIDDDGDDHHSHFPLIKVALSIPKKKSE